MGDATNAKKKSARRPPFLVSSSSSPRVVCSSAKSASQSSSDLPCPLPRYDFLARMTNQKLVKCPDFGAAAYPYLHVSDVAISQPHVHSQDAIACDDGRIQGGAVNEGEAVSCRVGFISTTQKTYVLEAWRKRKPKAAIALIGHVTCLGISSADDDCGAFE